MAKTKENIFYDRYIRQFNKLPQNEQALVREFFSYKRDGFYVDLGANEPIKESQSYHLEQLGGQGY